MDMDYIKPLDIMDHKVESRRRKDCRKWAYGNLGNVEDMEGDLEDKMDMDYIKPLDIMDHKVESRSRGARLCNRKILKSRVPIFQSGSSISPFRTNQYQWSSINLEYLVRPLKASGSTSIGRKMNCEKSTIFSDRMIRQGPLGTGIPLLFS